MASVIATRRTAARRWATALVAASAALTCASALSAQSQDEATAIRRCEGELNFVIGRDTGGRSPQAVIDERNAQVRRSSGSSFELSGTGRFARDNNDRGRPFTYRCTADVRSGRVNAQYQWSGGGFDEGYDRGERDYPPAPSWGAGRNASNATPQGRTWVSGGIISRLNGKGLDVEGRSNRNAANVQMWGFAGNPNQTWDVIDLGRGEYAIVSQGSNKVLEVVDNGLEDGADVVQFRWNGGTSQRWRFERTNGGFFQIVNVNSGRCLDVQDKNTQDGANVQQWTCSGQPNQAWRVNGR